MKNRKLKLLAFSCALALGLPTASYVHAQTNIPVTISTSSAITVTPGAPMDFGEWLLLLSTATGPDDTGFTLVMDATDGSITDSNVDGGDTTDDTTRFNLTAGTGRGTIDVSTPAAATINIYADLNQFGDTDFVISAPTFAVNANPEAALSTTAGTPSTFTTSAGGATDTLGFGATITVTGTPGDGVKAGGSMDVFISY